MNKISTIGLDVAKTFFQIHGADNNGKAILRKKLTRETLLSFFVNLPPCLVGIEACCGAHYWAREITKAGHTVKLIPPQYVKPFVKTNKNDAKDAEAICEAVIRPTMRFVPVKSLEQQDVQFIHRVRERLVCERTALANQIRGFLAEIGRVLPQGISNLRTYLPQLYEHESDLTMLERDLFSDLYTQLVDLDAKISKYEEQLTMLAKQSDTCRRLMSIPGIGPITSSALVSAVGDIKEFKNSRQFAAWLGLTPRQHSSGGKTRLLGISKWGNSYLRKLLAHGARTVLRFAPGKKDASSAWLLGVATRRGRNKAIIAQANKTARIVWAVLTRGEVWRKCEPAQRVGAAADSDVLCGGSSSSAAPTRATA